MPRRPGRRTPKVTSPRSPPSTARNHGLIRDIATDRWCLTVGGPRAVSGSQRYLTFAAAILVTGVLSGVVGGFTTVLVRTLEHLSFGYDQGPLLIGVRAGW